MRMVPADMQASLSGAATTIARCWRLTRRDGLVLGFTDHDEPLRFADTVFAAATGLSGGEAETALGLGVGTQEVEGALSAAAIREEDIAAGLYDGAEVETFLADWQRPERHFRLARASVGEIRRSGESFTAELRGPEAALDQSRGRSYRRRCDAAFGDRRCSVDLDRDGRTRRGLALEGTHRLVIAEGLGPFDSALFREGSLTLRRDGSAAFARRIAALNEDDGGAWRITLAEPLPSPPVRGDAVSVTAGCDKSFATCRDNFRNHLNFRGFPHVPGTDRALAVAKRDDTHDGMALVP